MPVRVRPPPALPLPLPLQLQPPLLHLALQLLGASGLLLALGLEQLSQPLGLFVVVAGLGRQRNPDEVGVKYSREGGGGLKMSGGGVERKF